MWKLSLSALWYVYQSSQEVSKWGHNLCTANCQAQGGAARGNSWNPFPRFLPWGNKQELSPGVKDHLNVPFAKGLTQTPALTICRVWKPIVKQEARRRARVWSHLFTEHNAADSREHAMGFLTPTRKPAPPIVSGLWLPSVAGPPKVCAFYCLQGGRAVSWPWQ